MGNINFDSNTFSKVYFGDTEVQKVYFGQNLVWDNTTQSFVYYNSPMYITASDQGVYNVSTLSRCYYPSSLKAGDLMVAICTNDGSGSVGSEFVNDYWTEFAYAESEKLSYQCFWKFASGSETTGTGYIQSAWTDTTGARMNGLMLTFRNVDPDEPIYGVDNNSATNTTNTPFSSSVSSSYDNSVLIGVFLADDPRNNFDNSVVYRKIFDETEPYMIHKIYQQEIKEAGSYDNGKIDVSYGIVEFMTNFSFYLKPQILSITSSISFEFDSSDTVVGNGTLSPRIPSTGADFSVTRTTTATYTDINGTMQIASAGHARIDYQYGFPELLIEDSATNYITYSSDYSQTSIWSGSYVTIESGSVISPDGTNSASKVSQTTNGTQIYSLDLSLSTNATVGDWYTFSTFIKQSNNIDYARIEFTPDAFGGESGSTFRLSWGLFDSDNFDTGVTPYIEYFDNGWYRCSITMQATSAAALGARIILSGGEFTYTDNGSVTNSIYICKSDLTNVNHPTSHIPTNGSTVTRNRDVILGAGDSSLINSEEGVLYLEMRALTQNTEYSFGNTRSISLSDGTSNNFISIYYLNTSGSTDGMGANSRVSAVTTGGCAVTPKYNYDKYTKIAFRYKSNDLGVWTDGIKTGADTSWTPYSPNTLDRVAFDSYWGDPFFGRVRKLRVYNTATGFTDNDFVEMTK